MIAVGKIAVPTVSGSDGERFGMIDVAVCVDADALADHAAAWTAELIRRSVMERGVATLALSGGSTPWAMLERLVRASLDWPRVHWFQVDERIAPDGGAGRNATGLLAALDGLPMTNIHLMPVNDANGQDAYESELTRGCSGIFDLVHLGLGADGHTASWPPGDPVADVIDRNVAMSATFAGYRRMTLTVPCVNRARERMFLVSGHDKASIVARLLAGDPSVVACRVAQQHTRLILDADAARALQSQP